MPSTSSQKRAIVKDARAKKISITLDERVLGAMQDRMKKNRSSSLSATISEALQRDLRREKLANVVAKYEAEHGAISDAEVEEARRKWRA